MGLENLDQMELTTALLKLMDFVTSTFLLIQVRFFQGEIEITARMIEAFISLSRSIKSHLWPLLEAHRAESNLNQR